MAAGRPVIALNSGGATETIIAGKTGEFFDAPEVEILVDGLRRLKENENNYSPEYLRASAKRFSRERFTEEITTFIEKALKKK